MFKRLFLSLLLLIYLLIITAPCYALDNNIRLTEDEQTFIKLHPVIRIGVDPGFEPFEFIDEEAEYKGIAADYLGIISERTGLLFEVVQGLTWPEAYDLAIEGEIDILPAIGKNEEREQYFLFSKPYCYFKRAIVIKNTETDISSIKDLEGLTVAVQRNSSHHSYLLSFPEINLSLYDSVESALAAVADGTECVFVGNLTVINYLIKTVALPDLKLIAFEAEKKNSLHFAARKGWPELVSVIDKTMAGITEEEKQAIINKWVDIDIENDYGPLIILILILGGIIAISLLVSLFWVNRLKKEVKKKTQDIFEMKEKYRRILDDLPALIAEFLPDSTLTYVNKKYCDYYDMSKEQLLGKKYLHLLPDDERKKAAEEYSSLIQQNSSNGYVQQILKNDKLFWYEWKNRAIFDNNSKAKLYYSIGTDITERKKLEEKEKNELKRLRAIFENNSAVILFIEPETGKILDANPTAIDFYGYTKEEFLEMHIQDINMLETEKVKELRLRALERAQKYFTLLHKLKNGEIRVVDVHCSPIIFNEKQVLISIIFDVTEKEEAMKEIKTLAFQDYLTGVYNRRYFEESFYRLNKKQNQTLAIIVGDINGLKMVNESFGHAIGDELIKEVAKEIGLLIQSNDILARIGGDEFGILITNATSEYVMKLTNLLEKELDKYVVLTNSEEAKVYLSVSFGYGMQIDHNQDLDGLMKEAEGFLYRRKYYNDKSTRSNMIKAMMSTLFQKSEREKRHSERVSQHCEAIAEALGWDIYSINRIKIAGMLHDIGKIGISETVLNKEGKLNDSEWELMKQHVIKGAAILEETDEYEDISYVIAAHHERWDGSGYCEGLQGEGIPIMARIIAVVDAYDAMTEQRTYKNTLTKKEAIAELRKCSGTQFDPRIVSVFIDNVISDICEI
jgi:diguanylate cyclase (GGDEF)-like protein/PAS domain S-box-containing protein/putative nucleotidyltransferase with HDIG domain